MSGDEIPGEALDVIYSLIDETTCEIILNIDHRLQKCEALQVCSSHLITSRVHALLMKYVNAYVRVSWVC
jgi:hypothetical protein